MKRLALILGLLGCAWLPVALADFGSAQGGAGGGGMSPAQGTGTTATTYLLDDYAGSAGAWSLRQLRTGVTNVVRVRRSSDDAEADFTATEVTDGTLTTWTGANDGFVETLYDQSGNGIDMTNTTAAQQPKLVSSGSLVTTDGGKPALEWDATDDYLTSAAIDLSSVNAASIFCVFKCTGASSYPHIFSHGNGTSVGMWSLRQRINTGLPKLSNNNNNQGAELATSIVGDGDVLLSAVVWDNGDAGGDRASIYRDSSVEVAEDTAFTSTLTDLLNTTSSIGWRVGLTAPTAVVDGLIAEIVLFAGDKSSDRVAIETAINDHYGIY